MKACRKQEEMDPAAVVKTARWVPDPGSFSQLEAEIEKRRVLEQLRVVMNLVLCLVAWFVRMTMLMLPSSFVWVSAAPNSVGLLQLQPTQKQQQAHSTSPIERSLCLVLALMNDLPASSRKYEFAKALAGQIVEENQRQGGDLIAVNRAALGAGFKRTVHLLARSLGQQQQLQQSHRQLQRWGWPWSRARFPVPALLADMSSAALSLCHRLLSASAPYMQSPGEVEEMQEKLAQELLWMTEKMGAGRDAVLLWASASSLAALSVSAPGKAQRLLLKLCVVLCKGLADAEGGDDVPDQVKLKLLLLWLPLFCNGADVPVFNAAERAQHEHVLEQLIRSLPQSDQEQVLSLWLREFALSPSDWPNLQHCYNSWCNSHRKLGQQLALEDTKKLV